MLWEATINEMISSNQIRSTMPDPENEPELYAKVRVRIKSIRVDHICVEVLLPLVDNASAIFLGLCLTQLIMTQPPYVMSIKPSQKIGGLSHSMHLHCWLGTPIVIFNMSLVKALYVI